MELIIEIIFLCLIVAILICNIILRNNYKSMSNLENETKMSGFEIAKIVSTEYCHNEVHIIKKQGKFIDHYNEMRNVIKLTPEVFDGIDIYAAAIAVYIALESASSKKTFLKIQNFCTFLIPISYILIALGACLNNISMIHIGLVLFVGAYIMDVYILTNNKINNKELQEFISKENLIKPFDNNYKLYILVKLSTLPYSFINYFK